ncbi:MAG TPA: glycosyltransferase, partial [Armatimonadota bacterium]|nr:glycosyltransferase [Armatimonadota bacterium]
LVALLALRNHRDYRCPAPWRTPPGEDAPLVSVLIPARNEAANIGDCLRGLLCQDYPLFEILVLDDGSTDDTAARVERLAQTDSRLRVVRGTGLPPGWAGKAHACWEVSAHAEGEWLLFLDADTRHGPELLSTALGEALRTRADLLSTFPRQEIGSVGEALTTPFVYWVLFTLLPMRCVWGHPSPALTAACGQFLLARRDVYLEVGGHGATPASLHDGLHLARLFKRNGKRVRLADLSAQISCRMYHGWRECWNGFSRNAYQALGSLPVLLFLTGIESALFLVPFLSLTWAAATGWPAWGPLTLAQVLLLLGIQVGLKRRFRYPWLTVLLHPVGILALLAIQWRSWWLTVTRTSLVWKGREVGGSAPVPEQQQRERAGSGFG